MSRTPYRGPPMTLAKRERCARVTNDEAAN
jgi:hypothetical protein